MIQSNLTHAHRPLFLLTAMSFLVLAGCARSDNGAPVYWSSGYTGTHAPALSRRVATNVVTPAAPVTQNQVYQSSPVAMAEVPRYDFVVVQPGDTLYRIAKTHEVTVADLARLNRLNSSYTLSVGQQIRVPPSPAYVVAAGDTVYSISKQYGVSIQELASVNRFSKPYRIKVGQQIQVPTQTATASIARSPAASPSPTAPVQSSSWLERVSEFAIPTTKPKSTSQAVTWSQSTPQGKPENGFLWPVNGRVISAYGTKQNGLHNDGINIAVQSGTKVHAARSGVVTYAGNELKGYGNLLLIKHDDGFVTAYAHNKRLLVRRGDKVDQGQPIAEAGNTGAVTTPQVHFEIRKGRNAVNPSGYLTGV